MKVYLLVIDPQTDFCSPNGSLSVAGAHDDMVRLATMVKSNHRIDDIYVTLDSHPRIHIAHPNFWRNSKGQMPAPFTQITAQDVRDGIWTPVKLSLQKRALDYVQKLDASKRYGLTIWPIHCVIATPGHCVYAPFQEALNEWQDKRIAVPTYITKGTNVFTEHYSAIKAEVPDPEDAGTQINVQFLQAVNEADIVLLAGEAGSHCLANTIRDAVDWFGTQTGDDSFTKKLVLLEDCTSPVTGFEPQQDAMIKDMVAKGMRVSKSTDWK